MVLFLASYPDSSTIKEGMFQRIASVDKHFLEYDRVYLTIGLRSYVRKYYYSEEGMAIYRLNLFVHFFLILKLFLKSNKVYIHSMYNALFSLPFLLFYKNSIVLDVHGVVPEEEVFNGNNRLAKVLNIAERQLFKKPLLTIVTVTDSMASYYKKKYPKSQFKSVNYYIVPAHLKNSSTVIVENEQSNIINILYSGNLQKWQNIDLMLDLIKDNLIDNYHYYILTGELDKMKDLFDQRIPNWGSSISILSLAPEELGTIYRVCHYGFVLRDDIIVNRVACPTKLVEYLFYGITPIVLDENIGDFNDLGYEYIKINQLKGLHAQRSITNIKLIEHLIRENNSIDLSKL